MQCYFKRFFLFCFAFPGSYIFISDQKVKAKSNRNRNCIFFHPLVNPKGRTLVHVPNLGGLSGSEDRGGGDNSIQFINFREGG